MYTMKDWERDGSFHAEPLEEIEESVYWEFYNNMPPRSMKRETFAKFYRLDAVFQNGEPWSCNENGLTFGTFGRHNGKFYFLGAYN